MIKPILLIIAITFSFNSWATVEHICKMDDFIINFQTNKQDAINIEVFKKDLKIGACLYDVDSYSDGVNSASGMELYRISKVGCNQIYDKIFSKVSLIESGYVKFDSAAKKSSAYIIKNQQPLLCNKKNKR